MKKKIRTSLFYVFCISILLSCHSSSPGDYKGTPYADIMYHGGPQTIPGKLQCEYYDLLCLIKGVISKTLCLKI